MSFKKVLGTKSLDGLPVIDAKDQVTITITAEDISGADIKRPETCAAARACRRQLHATEARVHLSVVYIKTSPDKWVRYRTPSSLRSEIVAFDRGGTFEPGVYQLTPVQPSQRLTGTAQGSKRNKTNPDRDYDTKLRAQHITTNVRTGPA